MDVNSPLGAAVGGIVAGLAATLLLSVLARMMPGMQNAPNGGGSPPPPADLFDRSEVQEWQARSQSPAPSRGQSGRFSSGAFASTPAGALTQPVAPGPEGLAEQFAFKVSAGLFAKDISLRARQWGFAVHAAYGSSWGLLYGLMEGTAHWPPLPSGVVFGFIVWLVGPAFLVPAMRIAPPLSHQAPLRTGMMIAGHIVYGITLALVFQLMEGRPT